MALTTDLPQRLSRLPLTPGIPGVRRGRGPAEPTDSAQGTVGRGSLVLFLALYLLLLAFFIMLMALSSLERQRSDAVLDSLSQTFAPRRTPGEVQLPLDDLTGAQRAAEAFIALVTQTFQSAVPSLRPRMIVPGRAVELRMRAEALFEPESDTLRPPRGPMLDSVIAAMAEAPPGLRFELALIAEVAETQDANDLDLMPEDTTSLGLRRAGAFGRFMNARGAAPGSVVVGLAPGDPAWLRLLVRAVDVGRWDPDLGTLPAWAIPIDAPSEGTDGSSRPADGPIGTEIAPNPTSPAPSAGFRGAQTGDGGAMMAPSVDGATDLGATGDGPPNPPQARPEAPARPVVGGGTGDGQQDSPEGGGVRNPDEGSGTVMERPAR